MQAAAHPTSMMGQMMPAMAAEHMQMNFPIMQVEVKIRVPDQLIGRLIGKGGICLKKIMEETQSHISISESRSQQPDIHQYQTPELLDRIITIRGTSFNAVQAAEKNVQQKLRQFHEQDMNMGGGGGGTGGGSLGPQQQQASLHQPHQQQQYCQTPAGVLLNPMDPGAMGPYGMTAAGAPMALPRDNAYQAAAYGAAQCIPMGVSPQPFYIQSPAAPNFHISTGQFAHNMHQMPTMPNSDISHQKPGICSEPDCWHSDWKQGSDNQKCDRRKRVSYVEPKWAIISIEGDRDPQKKFKRETGSVQSSGTAAVEKDHRAEQQTPPEEGEQQQGEGENVVVPVESQMKQLALEANNGTEEENDEHGTNTAKESDKKQEKEGGEEEGRDRAENEEKKEEPEEKKEMEEMKEDGSTKPEEEKAVAEDNNNEDGGGEKEEEETRTAINDEDAEKEDKESGALMKQSKADEEAVATNGTTTAKKTPTPPSATPNNNNNHHHQHHHHPAAQGPSSEQRSVFIQGYDFQVQKAQYWVFQKVADSQNKHPEDIVLTCEAIVPSKVIGRIIGKGGHNVKQLQLRSGAHIKVPDDINANDKNCVEAAVRVVGTFYAVQTVQHHFGTLITEAEWRESREHDERRARYHREGSR